MAVVNTWARPPLALPFQRMETPNPFQSHFKILPIEDTSQALPEHFRSTSQALSKYFQNTSQALLKLFRSAFKALSYVPDH